MTCENCGSDNVERKAYNFPDEPGVSELLECAHCGYPVGEL